MPKLNDFRKFLVEMETTHEQKANIARIIQALIERDEDWLSRQEISWGDKGNAWILNYGKSGGRNEFNSLVRGMIVRKPPVGFKGDPLSLIISFPFTRFFNREEKDAHPVNMANAEMLEKMDGTMVGVYFPDGNANDPHWHTRKMVSSNQKDMDLHIQGFYGAKYQFMPLIGQFVKKLRFNEEDANYTYVFEFIHDASAVLTKYKPDQYGLYLLGARNVRTHRELSEKQLDALAQRFGAKRPRRWDTIASQDEIYRMMKEIEKETKDFEGFVFRDKETGHRVKVKDPDYVKIHHMLTKISYKHLIPAIFEGEADEVMAYFPQAKEKVDHFWKKMDAYLDKAVAKVQQWQAKGLSRKDLATTLLGRQEIKAKEKWERKLAKLRGEKEPVVVPGEAQPTMRNIIMQAYEIKDPADIRAFVFNYLKKIGHGDDHQRAAIKRDIEKRKQASPDTWVRDDVHAGDPSKLLELLGIEDVAETSPTEEL